MNLAYGVIYLLLVLANIFFHCTGIYLLTLLKHVEGKIHLIYLFSVCCSELISSIISLSTLLLTVINVPDVAVTKEIEYHFIVVKSTLLLIVYFLTMVVILIDKVLEIMLNIKYAVYWNQRKAKILIITIWMFGGFLYLSSILAYHIIGFNVIPYFPKYIMLPGNILYIIFAVISYAYIFYNFNKSRMSPYRGRRSSIAETINFYSVFKKSRFFIPFTLILVYVIFYIIPTITYIILRKTKARTYIQLYISLSYNIAMFIDSWICIFIEPQVNQKLKKMIKNRRERKDIEKIRRQRIREIRKSLTNGER